MNLYGGPLDSYACFDISNRATSTRLASQRKCAHGAMSDQGRGKVSRRTVYYK
jgi:hypothetical protein